MNLSSGTASGDRLLKLIFFILEFRRKGGSTRGVDRWCIDWEVKIHFFANSSIISFGMQFFKLKSANRNFFLIIANFREGPILLPVGKINPLKINGQKPARTLFRETMFSKKISSKIINLTTCFIGVVNINVVILGVDRFFHERFVENMSVHNDGIVYFFDLLA